MKEKKQKKDLSGFFGGVFIVAIIVGLLAVWLYNVSFWIVLVGLVALFIINTIVESAVKNYVSPKEKAETARQSEERERKISNGEWNIPYKEFYQKCKAQGVGEELTDFTKRKIRLIVEDILRVPQEYRHLYLTDEKIAEYHAHWCKQLKKKQVANQKAEERQHITPQNATLSTEEENRRRYVESVWQMSPQDKRTKEIKRKIEEEIGRINGYRAMEQLADIVNDSVYQQPKHDWATLGGVASGIAGPAAGAAVAAQAMMANQVIEEKNAANRQFAQDFSAELRMNAQCGRNVASSLTEYEKELEKLKYKVLFDEYRTQTLFEELTFETEVINGYRSLEIKLTCTNNFKGINDEEVPTIIDGTFVMKVYCENVLIEKVKVAFPDNGIDCNGGIWEEICQLSKYMLDGDKRKYRFEFAPNRMWLMEK